jgi:Meiotically up-regulated gene 113
LRSDLSDQTTNQGNGMTTSIFSQVSEFGVDDILSEVLRVSKNLADAGEELEFAPEVIDTPVTIGDYTVLTTKTNQASLDVAEKMLCDSIQCYKVSCDFPAFKADGDTFEDVFEYAAKTNNPSLRALMSNFWEQDIENLNHDMDDHQAVGFHIDRTIRLSRLVAAVAHVISATGNMKSSSQVYFVLNKSRNILKIGYSASVDARFSNFVSATVDDLEIVGLTPGGRAEEMKLHHKFKSLRVRKDREWFYCSGALKAYIEYKFNYIFE